MNINPKTWFTFATATVMLGVTAMSAQGAVAADLSPKPPSAAIAARVVGGTAADQAASPTPWFALLTTKWRRDIGYCGGTVIGTQWIVTAAHCVTDKRDKLNRARSYVQLNPANSDDTGGRIYFKRVIVNPRFREATLQNDVALIQTSTPMSVPALGFAAPGSGPAAGTALEVFGFGATRRRGGISPILNMAALTDLTNPAGGCGAHGSDYYPAVMLCAGVRTGERDACQGDSGGPLTASDPNTRLVGIVSWGEACASPRFPGVYTRVSAVSAWITSVTGVGPS